MNKLVFFPIAIGFLLFSFITSWASASEAEQVFPDSTQGFFSIRNAEEMAGQWKETQVGKLMSEPQMKDFWEDLRKKTEGHVSGRFGITLDDIRLIPSGEIAGGMIAPVGQIPGFVLTMDVTGRLSETQSLLVDLDKKLTIRKAVKSTLQITGETATVFTFPSESPTLQERRIAYLLSGNLFIVSDQIYLLELIAKRSKGNRENPLSDVPGYIAVMKRAKADRVEGEAEPVIHWYVQPLALGESIRTIINLSETRKAKESIFKKLSEVGFDALQGAGGTVSLKSGNLENVIRTFVYAPQPHRLAMKMFQLQNKDTFTAPDWIPGNVAAGTTLYFDPLEAFDNFAPLFDAIVLQGGEGGWEDILREMKNDPNGAQIDIREELVKYLGQGVVATSNYQQPITADSENLLVAIEIKEGKEQDIQKALAKFLENDPEFEKRVFKDYIFWQVKPLDSIVVRPDAGVTLVGGPAHPGIVAPSTPEIEETGEPFFPNGAVTVANHRLLLSNNVKYLEEMLAQPAQESTALKNTDEFKKIMDIFHNSSLGKSPHFLESFANLAETTRPTYEMIRQGKMPQSRTLLGRALNLLLTPSDVEHEVRQARIDGSKMPDFETIKNHFGSSGFFGVSEQDGWFFKGFTLGN